jgi:hypothetical protein
VISYRRVRNRISLKANVTMRVEDTRGVHEEEHSLLHRHTLHTQRAVARTVDAVVARLFEAPAVRDEREVAIRTVLRAEDNRRQATGQRIEALD